MAKYLERKAVLKALKTLLADENDYSYSDQYHDGYVDGVYDAVDAVKGLPSEDVVKVVLCRDCKYFEPDGPYDGWCHGWSGMIVDDGYCSFGKASLDAEGDKWI